MGLFETLNRLGILSVGRRPQWRKQHETDGLPETPGAGISIAGSVKTLVAILPREDIAFPTYRVRINYVAGTGYEIQIDGNPVSATASSGLDGLLDEFVDEFPNELAPGVATVSRDDRDLIVRGIVPGAAFSVTASITSGAGTVEVITEATEVAADVYLLADGPGERPPTWILARNATLDVDGRGVVERLDTAGFSRMYVHVVADGACSVFIGPGVVE